MSAKDGGGQAFPASDTFTNREGDVTTTIHDGMMLRDYFAAKAMAAMIGTAAQPCMTGLDQGLSMRLAEGAYALADHMLEARK